MPVEFNRSEAGGRKDGLPNGSSLMTETERKLEKIAREAGSARQDVHHLNPPEGCDLCGDTLEAQRFLIDGTLRDDPLMWGYMCPDCFEEHGSGIGWGRGQLYERQTGGEWLLVAGVTEHQNRTNYFD